ncbi:flagellar FliJ family protein [Roseomonas sp. PWR1]|uniref:Flagellar FliJ protein n=1 Tax=Roseomonas nitratireducens TaxID=2820810 RepID=A0ABS4AVX0_9PROT|nr:flagellar FliJ family protein [Neoroseomonas nitratireducens]MBP0465504.1 flagellar FliJ family protein [Neoroseomonas nitratireducens]
MKRDPLATLEKLRRLEVTTAQRRLAEARTRLAAEEAAAAAVEDALRGESADAAPFTYGAFLARLLAAKQAQAAATARAEAAMEAERVSVAQARGAEKVVGMLRERRAAAERREALRTGQTRLDEMSQAMRGA